jgi:hypothetical protein
MLESVIAAMVSVVMIFRIPEIDREFTVEVHLSHYYLCERPNQEGAGDAEAKNAVFAL